MKVIFNLLLVLLLFSSCGASYNQSELSGEWVYKKVEYTNQQPVLVQDEQELAEKYPSITFTDDGKCKIYSGGKVISEGTFFLEKDIIRYEEVLQVGIKRKIPFLIKKLENGQIIFETLEKDVKRITAQKKK